MTPKAELFCKFYLSSGFNATRAAIKAGYSKKTAYSMGQKLLKKGEIQSEIKEYLKKEDEKLDYWRKKVLDELSIVAFSDITNYLQIKNGKVEIKNLKDSTPLTGAIASLSHRESKYSTSIKFKFWDKVKSLEAMAQILGLNAPERIEAEVTEMPALDYSKLSIEKLKILKALMEEAKPGRKEENNG